MTNLVRLQVMGTATSTGAMPSSTAMSGMDMGGMDMGGGSACKISVRYIQHVKIIELTSIMQMLWNWYTVDTCKSLPRNTRPIPPTDIFVHVLGTSSNSLTVQNIQVDERHSALHSLACLDALCLESTRTPSRCI